METYDVEAKLVEKRVVPVKEVDKATEWIRTTPQAKSQTHIESKPKKKNKAVQMILIVFAVAVIGFLANYFVSQETGGNKKENIISHKLTSPISVKVENPISIIQKKTNSKKVKSPNVGYEENPIENNEVNYSTVKIGLQT